MTVSIHPDPVPLRVDETGTIRLGKTRITLDVFLADHRSGMTPEQIVEQLETLTLPDVYGALAYYYRHKAELDEYLRERREEADRMQRQIEATQPTFAEMKARLWPGELLPMLPLLSDEDVPEAITEGLRQHYPGIDVVRVQEIGLMHTPDPIILDRAAAENRAIVTRDRNTMTAQARDRIHQGLRMAGLIVLAENISIGKAVQNLGTLSQAGDPGDLDGQILFLS